LKNSLLKKADYPGVLDVVPYHKFHLIPIDNRTPLEKRINSVFKRTFDLVIASLLLIVVSWIFPVIALLIKLDSAGPVFFLQTRNRRNGNAFTCIKFRTMIVNNDADTLAATENDSRITRPGAFLRKHHLDELPQLLNVLLGHMSIIGPRPYMISDNEKYEKLIKNYSVRHKIKPGITGLAQVVDYVSPVAKIENMEQRVKKDVYYVYNWSPWLDVKIMVWTFFKMLGLK
jgi:lipopolysaccharide/colanic/teichoic acid biosynthesis glycosyltransferase